MITLQYTHNKEPENYYTITLSTKPWFEPGQPESDVFLQEGYDLNFMHIGEFEESGEACVLIKMEMQDGEIRPSINWEAINTVCAGSKSRMTTLLGMIRNQFEKIDSRLLAHTPQGGEA